jgi:drug/metabolite transporter (DMT)-like permease
MVAEAPSGGSAGGPPSGARTLASVIAVVGGLGAALCWAIATMSTSRSSKMVGPSSVLAWVMAIGAVVAFVPAVFERPEGPLDPGAIWMAVIAGIAYIIGLSLIYRALQIGPVSVAAPVVSTEGALAAVFAVVLGEPLEAIAAVLLAVIAVGVILASREQPSDPETVREFSPEVTRRTAMFAIAAAVVFGVGLVTSAKAVTLGLPVMWNAFIARILGVALVTVPLVATGRLRFARPAVPFLIAAGIGEVVGTSLYTIGAQDGIAIAAVLGAQFATIAVVGAYLLFGERLSRQQVAGVGLVIAGVAVLTVVSV